MQDLPELLTGGERLLSFFSNPLKDTDQGAGFFPWHREIRTMKSIENPA